MPPIQMQVYMLSGIFCISLFLDIFFSIKTKNIRAFTFSNWGIILWVIILCIVVIPIRRGDNMAEWGLHVYAILHRVLWLMTPPIIFIIIRLKLYHEIEKNSNNYVDIFTYLESRRKK